MSTGTARTSSPSQASRSAGPSGSAVLVTPAQSTAIAWGIGGGIAAIAAAWADVLIRRGAGLRVLLLVGVALLGLLFAISRQGHGSAVVIVSSDGQLQPV